MFVCLFVFYVIVYFSDSLDELTYLVEKLFSPVVNKNIPVPEFPEHPYSDNELQVSHLTYISSPLSLYSLIPRLSLSGRREPGNEATLSLLTLSGLHLVVGFEFLDWNGTVT